jgi:hypothetical protein
MVYQLEIEMSIQMDPNPISVTTRSPFIFNPFKIYITFQQYNHYKDEMQRKCGKMS